MSSPAVKSLRVMEQGLEMMKRPLELLCALALVAPVALLMAPTPADACGNSMRYDRKNAPVKIEPNKPERPQYTTLEAEEAFKKGDFKEAVRRAMIAHPTLERRSRSYKRSKSPELRRAAWIAAISLTRLNGGVELEASADDISDDFTRRRQLDWAVEALEWTVGQQGDDPRYRSYLAEALARGQGTRDRAREILAELAQKDLMPDAHGWATLAHLQGAAGDEDAAARATKRCAVIGSPGAACDGGRVRVVVAGDPPNSEERKERARPKNKGEASSKKEARLRLNKCKDDCETLDLF